MKSMILYSLSSSWSIVNEITFLLGCCRADITKDQMVADLAFKAKIQLWSGIVLGSLSIGVLGFAVMRYSSFC
jgi:hypothetical protein